MADHAHAADPFFRLGRAIHRRRWLVIGLWLLAILAALPAVPSAARSLSPGGFATNDMEASRATRAITSALGENPSTLLVIFSSPTLRTTDPAYYEAVDASLQNLLSLDLVARVSTHRDNPRQAAPDGHTAYAVIALRSLPDEFRGVIPRVQGALHPSGLDMTLTGAPIFFSDIQSVTERDLRRAEIISFPFAGLALLLVFGSLVAALVPAVIGGTAVIVTLGFVVLVTRVTEVSIFAMSLVSMLGLGLGIDYSLFVVSRFRDELAERDVPDALGIAMATAGKAVLFSGLTVFIGLLGLTMFTFNALRSLGIAGSIVVALAMLASLTLLPAILAVVGRRIDDVTVLRTGGGQDGFWHGVAQRVMRRAGLVFVAVLVLLVLLGAPFLHVKLGAPDASILPNDVPSRQGFDQLRTAFGEGEISPILIAVTAPDSIYAPERLTTLNDFVSRIRADARVERVDSIVSLDPRLTFEQHLLIFADPSRIADPYARALAADTTRDRFTLVRVVSREGQTSDLSKSLVKAIRNTPMGGDLGFRVAGGTAGVIDYSEGMYSELPRALTFIVVATYLVLFLLSRIKEAYDGGLDNTHSVAVGLERSGRLITSAAAIVVLVSSSFIAADIVLIKALGLGTAVAVLLDASVVRGLLVPATMQLLGDWNWWAPRAVLRLLPARLGGVA